MKFEVLNRFNKRIFWNEYESCAPDTETQAHLLDSGYKLLYNDKVIESPIEIQVPETESPE